MLLSLTNRSAPATDLGFLLAKHPARSQVFELPFGRAHAFYPEAGLELCTFCLLLDIDPIGLVRRKDRAAPSIFEYVNDRPYAGSSFLCAAISKVLGSALNGRCPTRPELPAKRLDLEVRLPALACAGGTALLERLFGPLGYTVSAVRHPLDERFPEWGASDYHDVTLRAVTRVSDLLVHLYVLVPVLDDQKHYWVGQDEVEKLLEKGRDWLPDHPERELIAHRYLKHQRRLTREALERLSSDDDPDPDATAEARDDRERELERPSRLNDVRIAAVAAALAECGARSVADLGCGQGALLEALLEARAAGAWTFDRILGLDVSHRALEACRKRLDLERLAPAQRARIELVQGSLVYRDARLAGFDAAALVEVVEHVDPARLDVTVRTVFGFAHPRTVVVTTPNREYNALFPALAAGAFRHLDHRFEWTRAEFGAWCERVASAHGYAVRRRAVGPEHAELGAPTQMAVFTR